MSTSHPPLSSSDRCGEVIPSAGYIRTSWSEAHLTSTDGAFCRRGDDDPWKSNR